jgi:hypothetical protein
MRISPIYPCRVVKVGRLSLERVRSSFPDVVMTHHNPPERQDLTRDVSVVIALRVRCFS